MATPFAQPPFGAVMLSTMFALSDDQLALVMTAAGGLEVEKRGVFLERVAARRRGANVRFWGFTKTRTFEMQVMPIPSWLLA